MVHAIDTHDCVSIALGFVYTNPFPFQNATFLLYWPPSALHRRFQSSQTKLLENVQQMDFFKNAVCLLSGMLMSYECTWKTVTMIMYVIFVPAFAFSVFPSFLRLIPCGRQKQLKNVIVQTENVFKAGKKMLRFQRVTDWYGRSLIRYTSFKRLISHLSNH